MTNARFDGIDDFRDIESLNHYARRRSRPARRRATCWPRCGDEPRQRPHPDAVGRLARTPGSPPARRGSRSTRTTPRSTPRRRVADPDSVFHHYRRLIELRHDEPAVAHGDFTLLLPDHERVYAFTRRLDASSCSCWPTSPARPPPWTPRSCRGGTARRCWSRPSAGNRPDATSAASSPGRPACTDAGPPTGPPDPLTAGPGRTRPDSAGLSRRAGARRSPAPGAAPAPGCRRASAPPRSPPARWMPRAARRSPARSGHRRA